MKWVKLFFTPKDKLGTVLLLGFTVLCALVIYKMFHPVVTTLVFQ